MTGILGFAGQFVLFLSLIYHSMRWLGVAGTRAERRFILSAVLIGGTVGAGAPYLIERSFRFSGVGLPMAVIAGLWLYLTYCAVTRRQPDNVEGTSEPYALLLIGLVAAVVAHFVEIQLGIAIAVTHLYFWVYAGVAVAVGVRFLAPEHTHPPAQTARSGVAPRPQPLLSSGLLELSPILGLILIVLTFNFYMAVAVPDAIRFDLLLWLFLGTWFFGAVLLVGDSAAAAAVLTRLGSYTAVAAGLWLLFTAMYTPWVYWSPEAGEHPIEKLAEIGGHAANTISIFYVFVGIAVGVAGLITFFGDGPPPAPLVRPPRWHAGGYALLLLAAAPLVVATNLNVSRADTFSKHGAHYEQQKLWDAARIVYEQALALQPRQGHYAVSLSRVLVAKARAIPAEDAPQREQVLQRALAVLQRPGEAGSLDLDRMRSLAHLHAAWASLAADPAERERHFDEARTSFERTTTLSPNIAVLWNEWAVVDLERQQADEALARLDRSLKLNNLNASSHVLRGTAHVLAETFAEALADYDRALAIDPTLLEAWRGKGIALTGLGRFAEAIATNQQALELDPGDFISHRNLALLYHQSGQDDLALGAAEAARAVADPGDRAALNGLIEQLKTTAAK